MILCAVRWYLRYPLSGIAKLSDAGRSWPEVVALGGHLEGVSVPQIESVGSGLAVGFRWHAVAAGAENDIDLVVGGEEPLRLARRLESPHQLFAFPGWPM